MKRIFTLTAVACLSVLKGIQVLTVPIDSAPALVSFVLALQGCGQRDGWETGTVTLVVGERGPDIAEVVFEKNQLVRVDYKTDDQPTRDRLQARLDEIMRQADRLGLLVKYHDYGLTGRGALRGAKPKPGAPQFARAVYHHLSDEELSVRAK